MTVPDLSRCAHISELNLDGTIEEPELLIYSTLWSCGILPKNCHVDPSPLAAQTASLATRGFAHSTRTEILTNSTRMSHIRNSAWLTFYLIRMSHNRYFYPTDIPLSPDVSQLPFYPSDIPLSPNVSHSRHSIRPTSHSLRISHSRHVT